MSISENIRKHEHEPCSLDGRNVKHRILSDSQINADLIYTFPVDVIQYIGRFLGAERCILRLVCKRWCCLIPRKCLRKLDCQELVNKLEVAFKAGFAISPTLSLACEMYKIMHYYPPTILPPNEETKEWEEFFEATPELHNINWMKLLDNHFEHFGMPKIFLRKNLYAFKIVSQLKKEELFIRPDSIPVIHKFLKYIVGHLPNFYRLMHRNKKDKTIVLKFPLHYQDKEHLIVGTGVDQKGCFLSFCGRLLVFLAKTTESYYDIAEEIANTAPVDWQNQLNRHLTKFPPEEQTPLETVKLEMVNGVYTVTMRYGKREATGVGPDEFEARYDAYKEMVLAIEKALKEPGLQFPFNL